MTAAPLTVHNAEITTARVEIQKLTVSGKQVTLAVFRQLQREHLIQGDQTLAGQPWGVVNYHDRGCPSDHNDGVHHHVVWQKDRELRRDTVTYSMYSYYPSSVLLSGQWFVMAVLRDLALTGTTSYWDGHPPLEDMARQWLTYTIRGLDVDVRLPEDAQEVAHFLVHMKDPQRYQSAREELTTRPEIAGTDTHTLFDRHLAEVMDELALRRRLDEIRDTIRALPQLFIAV